jgi:Leucine-rich repeat (LRR) protein
MSEPWITEWIAKAQDERATDLDWSWLELASLPPAIGELTNLVRLSLHANWLRDLPAEFAQMRNLIALLDIGDNLIHEKVPDAILAMLQLEELNLENSFLPELPEELARLTSLRKLLSNLRNMDLANNQLTTLPRELSRIPTFNFLELDGNPWEEPLAAAIPKPPYCANIEAIYACLRQ